MRNGFNCYRIKKPIGPFRIQPFNMYHKKSMLVMASAIKDASGRSVILRHRQLVNKRTHWVDAVSM